MPLTYGEQATYRHSSARGITYSCSCVHLLSLSLSLSSLALDILRARGIIASSFLVRRAYLSVGTSVTQETEDELGALLGPAALRDTSALGLSVTAGSSVEAAERNRAPVVDHVLEKLLSAVEAQVSDGVSSLARVL